MAQEGQRLLRRWRNGLPDALRRAVQCTLAVAGRRDAEVFLVGGAVRDVLLGEPHVDVDLVTEADAIGLAVAAGRELGARAVAHPRFGTAAIKGDGFRLDLARAREETYERPGALPSVRPGCLADDLARRDFTINAMALQLTGRHAGGLLDPHDGRADLTRRRLRVLHDRSFQDDATRILRAMRYAGRLRLTFEPHTKALLRRDLAYLETISGARLRHELERIAVEPRARATVLLASRCGVLRAVHPALNVDAARLRAIDRAGRLPASRRDVALFCVLLAGARPAEGERAITRLALTGRQASAVRGFLALQREATRLARPSLKPSRVVALLSRYPGEAIEVFAIVAGRSLAGDRARRYLAEWRAVRPRLDGREVEALGVARGPKIGIALALLRDARLDGRTRIRQDEEALVQAMVRRKKNRG